MFYRIPDNRLLAVRKLAKDCANYDDGECLALDCNCMVQQDTVGIVCKYYMNSVLPADPKLHREVLLASEVKDTTKKYSRTCKQCKTKFKAITKNTLHCDKCQKKLDAERAKRAREKKRAKKGQMRHEVGFYRRCNHSVSKVKTEGLIVQVKNPQK